MSTTAQVRSEESAGYHAEPVITTPGAPRVFNSDDDIIAAALAILEARSRANEVVINGSGAAIDWLRVKFAPLDHEVFSVLWLDQRNRVIELSELFRGTATEASIHPREVVKDALLHNATQAILVHNHPSGSCAPSHADQNITGRIIAALDLVDVKVLDHVIVGLEGHYSFKEHGLI